MCVSVAGGGSRPVRSSSSNQEQEQRRVQQQLQQESGDSQCVSVERRRSSSSSSVDCDSRRGRRALGSGQAPTAVGMAPALTQATPHQRSCCAPNPHSVTLAQPSNHKHQHHLPTVEDKQSAVWPASSHCCGGGGGSVGGGGGVNGSSSNVNGGNGAVKPTRRNTKYSNNSNNSSGGSGIKAISKSNSNGNSSSCNNKKEIARSDNAEAKSRTGGEGGGRGSTVATAAVVDGQSSSSQQQQQQQMRSLSAPTTPPTLSADSGVNSSKAAVAPRSSPNGGGVVTNGTKTMGLQPATAPGDRMDLLDSSPPPMTDVPTSTPTTTTTASTIVAPGKKPPPPPTTTIDTSSTTTPIHCWTATDDVEQADSITGMTECPDVEEATVDEIFNVLENIEAENGMAGLSVAEQQLLHAAAVAVLGEDGVVLSTTGIATTAPSLPVVSVVDKEAEVERRLCEARTKQQQIEQRCQTLLRRAGRLQSRHVSRHVADQVANFVVYARETLSLGTSGGGRGSHSGAGGINLYGWAEDGRLPTREEVRNIPTATLVNLVSRLQAPPVSYLSNRRYFGLPSRSTNQGGSQQQQQQQQQHPLHPHHLQQQHQQKSSQKLSTNVAETLEEVAGLWEAQLRYLQRHDDPDATESSSGGESDDDMPVPPQAPVNLYTPITVTATTTTATAASSSSSSLTTASSSSTLADPQQLQSSELVLPTPAVEAPVAAAVPTVKPVPTYQRAAWRWARDRAAVAARWSWLQAQVSDLEYRIRQHTDVYRQLRQAKGALHFVGANGLTGTTSGNGILNAISNNPTTPAASSAVKESNNSEHDEKVDGENCTSSSRTRPLVTGGTGNASGKFRHRRLIRASQVTAGSGRKPSRPHSSTVRCCCVMSRICHPCVLCNGKNNYLLPVDPDGMTLRERIGLVDRGFHPVLSLPQDVPLSAHVDSLLKSGDWRPPPPSVTTPAPPTDTTTSASTTSTRVRRSNSKQDDDGVGGGKRRPVKRKKPVDAEEASAKIERRKALLKRRKRATLSSEAMDDDCGSFPSSPYADGGGSVPSTPGRSSMGGSQQRGLHQDLMRRRTSYDIDNIVIPYSMAATTRVERLQYKEIQTPKWRAVGEEDDANEKLEGEEVEDVTEEACIARHERSEQEERRKFMTYLKQPAGLTRGRRRVDHMAADSRTEHSSGANTPDPVAMSPGPENSSTPLASAAVGPAALPVKVPVAVDISSSVMDVDDDAADTSSTATEHFPALATKERRRTASLTKKDAVWKFIQDDNSGMSWDLEEQHYRPVVPYEPRHFPLPDSVYEQLVTEMPPDELEEEQQLNPPSSSVKREMRTSECSTGGPTPSTPVLLTPGGGQQQQSTTLLDSAVVSATPGTFLGEQSRAATPATFLSESIGSPGADEDLDIDEDDPNDPEWEGSEGSAPKSVGGGRKK